MPPLQIYQLKIALNDIEPPIWRRIQIPNTSTFWDLHSYIQDAFGWTNNHMHKFTCIDAQTDKTVVFGVPFEPEHEDDAHILPGWERRINLFIEGKTGRIEYTYDLGDNWSHSIVLEEILTPVKGFKYPFCVDGERACPPEDCGGPYGYIGLLETIFDPVDPDHKDMVAWVDSMKGCTFDPEQFYAAQVRFVSPSRRFREIFG